MEIKEILSRCDHTLLAQTATWEEIRTVCQDGMRYGCASVCIPAVYVRQAAEYVQGKLPICTVIGFPNGYDTTAAKCFMAADAIKNGAAEIDMVIQLGWVEDCRWQELLEEIQAVKSACGSHVLKVIIETCLLTQEEKLRLCEIVTESGADYIKTSTGFGGRRPVCRAHWTTGEDQGGGRHRDAEGCGGFYPAGCIPAGYQPDREGGKGDGGGARPTRIRAI